MKESTGIILRKNGLKATKQRIVIFDYLMSTKSHPTVEEIFENVKPSLKKISYATVYNVLNDFLEKGLAMEISTSEDAKRYDGHLEPHIHLICTKCGKIKDLTLDTSFLKEQVQKSGFKADEMSINIYGVCPDCLKAVSQMLK